MSPLRALLPCLALVVSCAAGPVHALDLLDVHAEGRAGLEPPRPDTARAALDAFLAVYYDSGEGIVRKSEPAVVPRVAPANPFAWIADRLDRARDRVVRESQELIRLHKADYWWVPHFIEMAIDSYELTGDARDLQLAKRLSDGLWSPYYYWWFNSFNDDLGWFMLAQLRAYEVSRDRAWLEDARKLHRRIREFLDGAYGGGVWWKRDGTRFKNVPINAPFVIASMKLFRATGDPRYRQDALDVYAWMERTLWHSPQVWDGIDDNGPQRTAYTYNHGTFIGASLAVHDETHDPAALANAVAAADWAIANLAPGGIMKDEGSGDAAGFKMIMTRYLVDLAVRPGGEKYLEFLDRNATAAWANRRQKDSIMGYDWSKPAPVSAIQSFTAAAGVDIILQSRLAHKRLGR